MKWRVDIAIVALGLALGWLLGRPSPVDEVKPELPVGKSLLGSRQPKASLRLIDASLPEHLQLLALAEQEDLTDVSSLKASLAAILQSGEKDLLANLMRQWVAVDSHGCFAYCRDWPDPYDRVRCLKAWAREWALSDPQAALAEIESLVPISEKDLHYNTIGILGATLGSAYPDAVLALIEAYGDHQGALLAVSKVAPERAMAIARTKNDDYTARSILGAWLQRDQEAALGYFSDQPEAIQRDVLEHLGKALAREDPILALEFMKKHRHLAKDSGGEHRVFQAAGRVLSGQDGELAKAFFKDLASPGHPNQSLLKELLPTFAVTDPTEALSLALQQSDEETLHRVVGKVAREDWDLAYDAVMQLEDGADRNRALEGLLSIYSNLPNDIPLGQLTSLIGIAEENGLNINLGVSLKLLPMAQVEELIATYPETLDTSLEYLFSTRSTEDLKQLAQRLPDSPGKQRGLERAVRDWSGKDPASAAEWVQSLELEGDAEGLYEPLVASWSAADPIAAREWLRDLDNAEHRSIAARVYVRINAVVQSAVAWEVATEQGDPNLQQLALKGWAITDPDAAEKALEALDHVDPKLLEVYEGAAQEHQAWDRFLHP